MKVKLVGFQRQDYDMSAQNGPKFNGHVLQCVTVGEDKDGLTGELVKQIKLPDGHPCAMIPLELGKQYTVYFDDKKHLDYLAETPIK